ncbi:MAG: ceramidase domain-containing protein [Gammaproteobacteria bacterium]|nr:MAG: ceramidase domain-containing protein [Gammaproteobacteria bacterium]
MISDTRGYRFRLACILGLAVLAITTVTLMDPIPQDPAYHEFVDQRMLYGVPNFWNVASNSLFVISGLLGILLLMRQPPVTGGLPELRPVYLVFFTGVFLTGFGSAYYHLDPSNDALVWDRLPMTLAFMAFFSMIVGEHLSPGTGRALLWPLLVVGVLSIVYWHITESAGRGDLRPYALVQFLPMVLIPVILLLFQSRLNRSIFLWAMIAAYVVSKIAEYFDAELYAAGGILSGHSVKHIAAAVGTLFLYMALRKRRLIEGVSR